MTVATRKRGIKKHKTKLDREATLQEVARLARMKYTQSQIAERVGVTQPMVCQYVKELDRRYRESQVLERDLLAAEMEANYHAVIRDAEDAWRRSQRSEDEEEQRAGEATFLRVKMEAWKAIRELRGLDQPVRVEQKSVNLNFAAGNVPVVGFDALAEPEPVEAEIERVKALPEHKTT